MSPVPFRAAVVAFGVLSALPVAAQTAPRPDPLDPRAAVPPVVHRSVLSGTRPPPAEVPVGSWKDANDTVARIGGWRAYAREAARPEPKASAPKAAP